MDSSLYKNKQIYLVELLHQLKKCNYSHTSITPTSHEIINSRPENNVATNLNGIFGWSRPFIPSTAGNKIFDLMMAADILKNEGKYWLSKLRVSSINEHLLLHSAYPTDNSNSVFFGPDTYRFINAIQHFLEQNNKPIFRAVDIGTGTGAGAIKLAKSLQNSQVIAVDINDYALELASINVESENIHNINLINSDLLKSVEGTFDLIVANPPYLVDSSERAYRHGGSSLGAELSLSIVDTAIERLSVGGTLLLYTGVAIVNGQDSFEKVVSSKLKSAGFNYQYHEIDPDVFGEELLRGPYANTDRISVVVLTVHKHN